MAYTMEDFAKSAIDGNIEGSIKQAFNIFCNANGLKTNNPHKSLDLAIKRVIKKENIAIYKKNLEIKKGNS